MSGKNICVCSKKALDDCELPRWEDIKRDPSVLFVMHALYLHGARFSPAFERDRPEQYHVILRALLHAVLVESLEVHFAPNFASLRKDARIAWILTELLLRCCLFLCTIYSPLLVIQIFFVMLMTGNCHFKNNLSSLSKFSLSDHRPSSVENTQVCIY